MRFQQLDYTIVSDYVIKVPTKLTYDATASYNSLKRYFRLIYDETQDEVLWSTGGHTLVSTMVMVAPTATDTNTYIEVQFNSTELGKVVAGWKLSNHELTIAMDYGESPQDILDAIVDNSYVGIPVAEMDKVFDGWNIIYKDGTTGSPFSGVMPADAPTVHLYYNNTTLPTVTKTGYTFGGWYDNVECTGTAMTQINEGVVGDFVVYAKWTAV